MNKKADKTQKLTNCKPRREQHKRVALASSIAERSNEYNRCIQVNTCMNEWTAKPLLGAIFLQIKLCLHYAFSAMI